MTVTGPAAGRAKKDPLQVVVHDPELEGEIALLMDLIVAVAHANVPLGQDAIDAILDTSG